MLKIDSIIDFESTLDY